MVSDEGTLTGATLQDELRSIERRRLRSLVEVRVEEADALHAPDFQLVHPGGGVWSRAEYPSPYFALRSVE
jgi:hypothetical protein